MFESDMLETHTYVALTHADERSNTNLQFQIVHSPDNGTIADRDVVEQILGMCDAVLALDSFSVENALVTGAEDKVQHWRVSRAGTLIEWTRREILDTFGEAVCSVVDGNSPHLSATADNRLVCTSGRVYERHVQEYNADLRLRCIVPAQLSYDQFVMYTSQGAWQDDCLRWSIGYPTCQLVLEGDARGYSACRQDTLTRDFVGKVAALHFGC